MKLPLLDTHLHDFTKHFFQSSCNITWVKMTGLGACLYMIFLGGCVSQPFANLEEWKEIRTRHFNFYSNAEERVALEIASKLENFRTIALKLTNIPPFQDHSLRVYVFKNRSSFTPFQPYEKVGGFFIQGPNYIVINANAWNISASSIIYHEYIHYLLSKHPAYFPLWYEEGLAGLFETVEYQDKTVKFGIPPNDRWVWLDTEAEWIPMDQLLLDQVDFTANEGFTDARAQSWAIMHYFVFGKEKNFLKLGQYIFLVNHGMPPHQALKDVFGLTPEELLVEVKQYIAQDELDYNAISLTRIDQGSNYQFLPITQVEAKRVLQDLLLLVKQYRDRHN